MNEIKQDNKKIKQLKEYIKHRQKGVGLEKKQTDENRQKHTQTQNEELIKLVN